MAVPDVEPAVRELSRALLPETPVLARDMADRIRAEVAVYRDEQLVSRAELDASCGDNLRYVLGNLAGAPVIDGQAPRATGTARAERGVPYAAVLQAFRIGGRFIWELLVERADPGARDILLRAAADIWAVTDDLSAQVTEAYRTALADQVRRDGQVRAALVGTLLDGDVAAAEQLWESASLLRLPRRGEFVVVAAHCPSPGTEGLPGVDDLLRRHDVPSAWRLDHEYQDGVVALRARFRLDRLTAQLSPIAHGRVGLSTPFHRIDDAPRALREARLACAAATPGSRETVGYADRPSAVLLATTPDAAEALARRVLGPVLDLPAEDRRLVLETARIWLAADGSTSAAAQRLHLHRNTVRYRLRRLEELSGRNLGRPVDIAEVHLALESIRILGLQRPGDSQTAH